MSFKTHTLPDSETWAIINALRVAADQYDADAKTQAGALSEPDVIKYTEARERMVRGFTDQAALARSLADTFENAESISIKVVSET